MVDQATIDALRDAPVAPGRLFVDGEWSDAATGATGAAVSPIDGSVLTSVAHADSRDVDRAVTAARTAFDRGVWSRSSPAFRQKVMHRLADLVEMHAAELAVLGVRDNGTEIATAYMAEPMTAAGSYRHSAECVDKIYGEIAPTEPSVLGMIHREPVGVVGVILPWNMPLMIMAWKVGAALAVGNSVVLKPSEDASLSVLRVTELFAEAGLPPGVLNVVTGSGAEVGDALARHMDVDVIAFTGSGPVGRQLLNASADSNLKRVYLELGGKSPNVVFADAPDVDEAAEVSAKALFKNAGQICVAPSRILVEAAVHDEFVERLVDHATGMHQGDPLDLATEVGAIASERQLASVLARVDQANAEGAELLCGGKRVLDETGGSYVAPTVFGRVAADTSLFQEEVFGPVLAVTAFDTEDEALRLANGTVYGLAAAVWTGNLSRAHRMIAGINAGMVQVNAFGPINSVAPVGGVKQSGNGVDKSLHAFDKYLNYKTAWVHL